jgi:hypothetical protein
MCVAGDRLVRVGVRSDGDLITDARRPLPLLVRQQRGDHVGGKPFGSIVWKNQCRNAPADDHRRLDLRRFQYSKGYFLFLSY